MIAFNFTSAHFAKGATQWSHLREPYATLFNQLMNLAAHTIGNKQIDHVAPHQVVPKRPKQGEKYVDLRLQAEARLPPPFEAYGKLKGSDNIALYVETLFDATSTTQVNGFRLWIVSRLLKNVSATNNSSAEIQVPVDPLAVSFARSIFEGSEILRSYHDQYLKHTAQKGKGKKGGAYTYIASTPEADLDLYPLYLFARYGGDVKDAFTHIMRKTLVDDVARATDIDDDEPWVFPSFVDTRDLMRLDYVIHNHSTVPYDVAQNLFRNTFTKEAAMFYHVRSANINEAQRNLNTYIHRDEQVRYDPKLVTDVGALSMLGIKDSALRCFYNPRTTYHVKNEHISAEFLTSMPLPHRIGSHLQIIGAPTISLAPDPILVPANEEDDHVDIDCGDGGGGNNHQVDESWLDENDVDGTMAQRIFERIINNCSASAEAIECKPLGIHNVQYMVTARDMLVGNMAKNVSHFEEITETQRRKFLSERKEVVALRLKATVATVPKLTVRTMELLALYHTTRESLRSISATPSISLESNVYKSSTPNYLLKQALKPITVHEDPAVMQIEEEEAENDANRLEFIEQYQQDNMEYIDSAEPQQHVPKPRCFANKNLEETIPYLEQQHSQHEARRGASAAAIAVSRNPNFNVEWESFIANGSIDVFLPVLKRRRAEGNTMADIQESADLIREEDWLLERNVFLRIGALNKKAFRTLDTEFYGSDGRIKDEDYDRYKLEKGRLIAAMLIEVWQEFFHNEDVSVACKGVRKDWEKATTQINGGKKTIAHSHKPRVYRLDVRPYHQFKIWCYDLFAVILLIHYNYKLMYINYLFKFHHCRHYVRCNNPKLNGLNHGDNMGGKSYMLTGVKLTCPSDIGDNITAMTDNAFNVEHNLDDMLILIDEMQDKYLGINGPAAKGSSAAPSGDALNFFKNRLTSQMTQVLHWFNDEENGNKRSCKHSKASVQGNYLGCTNAKLADADKHLISRFTLLSVPRSIGNDAASAKQPPKRVDQFASNPRQGEIMYEEHKDVHRLYFFVEKCITSGIFCDQLYGVSISGANMAIEEILNRLQREHNIPTNHDRKRNAVLELSRVMCIASVCWIVLCSPVFHYLQYDPISLDYIGINPRLVLRGVAPLLLVTKDHVIDALTALSTVWQHDHLKSVLEGIAKLCNLTHPLNTRFRLVPLVDGENLAIDYSKAGKKKKIGGAIPTSAKPSREYPASHMYGANSMVPVKPDYNYICISDRSFDAVYKTIAKQLGALQISSNDIEKILKDLSEEQSDVSLPSYTYTTVKERYDELVLQQQQQHQQNNNNKPFIIPVAPRPIVNNNNNNEEACGEEALDNEDKTQDFGCLVLDHASDAIARRKLVHIDYCPATRRPRVCILVSYLKEQLPTLLEDAFVQDLKAYQVERARNEEIDAAAIASDGEEKEEKKKEEEDEQASPSRKRKAVDTITMESLPFGSVVGTTVSRENTSDTFTTLIQKLQKSALYNSQTEIPLVKAIRKYYETPILEKTELAPSVEETMAREYSTLYSNMTPWLQYTTCESPQAIRTMDAFPDLPRAIKNSKEFVQEISFHDTTRTLLLERKETGKVTISNYAYISPSALASLSINDTMVKEKEKDIVKATNRLYGRTALMVLTEDIDFTFAKAHLAMIAYEPIDAKDDRFLFPNYPPFQYQIHTDYSRTRLELEKQKIAKEREERRAEFHDNAAELARLDKEAEEELLNSIFCEYPLCNMLSKVNHQGDIMNGRIHGNNANCVNMNEMLLANCNRMKLEYAQSNSNVVRCKKRVKFNNHQSLEQVRRQANNILRDRLSIKHQASAAVVSNTNTVASALSNRNKQASAVPMTMAISAVASIKKKQHATEKKRMSSKMLV